MSKKQQVVFTKQHSSRSLCISFPSLHDYDAKLPNFTFYRRRIKHHTKIFLNLDLILENSTARKFANIWENEQRGMIGTKFETVQIHFVGDVLVTVPVVVA